MVIGLTGKYMGPRDTYASIHNAIEHAATHLNFKAKVIDIPTDKIEDGELSVDNALAQVQGIIVPGGFGKRGAEGKIQCVQYARERNMPYLGLCYGFQMAAIEFARNVCGLDSADTTEKNTESDIPLIDLLPEQYEIEGIGANMRLGARNVTVKEGTLAHSLYKSKEVSERFRHRYEFNPKNDQEYRKLLESKGMIFSGWAPNQPIMQILELPSNKFHLCVQYHPEFQSTPFVPHPIFLGFMKAFS